MTREKVSDFGGGSPAEAGRTVSCDTRRSPGGDGPPGDGKRGAPDGRTGEAVWRGV